MAPAGLTVRIGACLLLAGCGFGRSAPNPEPPGTRLDLPAGFLGTTAWLPDGYVYVVRSPDPGAQDEVWRVAPGRPAEQLALPDLAGCHRTNWMNLSALPDGRLGLARYCIMDDPEQSHIDAVAFNPTTRQVQLLAPLGEYNPTAVSWRKDLQSGFVSYGNGTCGGFAPLSPGGVGQLPKPLSIDGRSWAVDQVFFEPATADCTRQGRADQALLTPDERRLVFWPRRSRRAGAATPGRRRRGTSMCRSFRMASRGRWSGASRTGGTWRWRRTGATWRCPACAAASRGCG